MRSETGSPWWQLNELFNVYLRRIIPLGQTSSIAITFSRLDRELFWAARVSQGGHNIPENIICRRFDSGLKNFDTMYKQQVDAWMLYANSESKPRILAWGEK